MSVQDSEAVFQRIPWAAALLNQPDIVCAPVGSRVSRDGKDSLYAETLKTSRTIANCVSIYKRPSETDTSIDEVSTLLLIGDGLEGHANIMHGGIVATILDEGMGILQATNLDWEYSKKASKGLTNGELAPTGSGTFTVFLNIKYLAPVRTPGSLAVTAKYVKKEGRKEWMQAEIRQFGEGDGGKEIVCATCEALFVRPKSSKL
ncbi:hypothetical protein BAUCODRAFT_435262 [Baudoinia panamericana UAMH 10762]|uniref:Thioesterase domain-containing protein n=1 Tax=Baudoinia panamericana (strain UAMH 10762) TaxID=717646 RepID=M2LRE4_BAUPA|nr:uncharacterized protein BAUCODRAFT_435262 [Baudoinia panamericana UAMH 10762]EMC96997.1 hypothetical protein BAUCODRAFT_435262 [Baudoinia panamericana UAMH 10762]